MRIVADRKLIQHFEGKPFFSKETLLDYFEQEEEILNENTFIWRIHNLKKRNILQEIKKGIYTLRTKPIYTPPINNNMQKLLSVIENNFNGAKYCIWNIDWLNEFTIHQFSKKMIIIEIEKDLQESLVSFLSDEGYENILWSINAPPAIHISAHDPIAVTPLITRSPLTRIQLDKPTRKKRTIMIPTLEKMLVDIFEDEKLFHFVQGAEMEKIVENAINHYGINFTTLFSYAKRRGKETTLQILIAQLFPDMLKIIE